MERTLAIIKPDAFSKRVCGNIISFIEKNGLDIIGIKTLRLSTGDAEKFYAVHAEKPFYSSLVEFMISGPIIVLALEAPDAISTWRRIMGATNPEQAAEGTIRKLFGTSVQHNAAHGSDAPETAATEIAFFFTPEELRK